MTIEHPGASDTIFALSSGNPPAAIAVVRVSGPAAGAALEKLSGRRPEPRRACLAALRSPATGELIDRALVLWFPGPGSSTGEDLAEFHLHGGRSVVSALLSHLSTLEGLRPAVPGEFTRRAFENGRIDLTEAEGLADLLAAETEGQRRAALLLAGGALGRKVEEWQTKILALSAQIEALLDFSDEADVEEALPSGWTTSLRAIAEDMERMLGAPSAERLREGIRVVIAGPPNAGKSSLLNALVGREAAIVSTIAGTTRDLVEAPTAIGGAPFLLIDTAGLRDSGDEVESIGIGRARQILDAADLILWLGAPKDCPDRMRTIMVQSKRDLQDGPLHPETDIGISSVTGEGVDRLAEMLIERARELLPKEGETAINRRHRALFGECLRHLREAEETSDLLIASEALRQSLNTLDRVTGRAGVEDMLDALFGRFCIGK